MLMYRLALALDDYVCISLINLSLKSNVSERRIGQLYVNMSLGFFQLKYRFEIGC